MRLRVRLRARRLLLLLLATGAERAWRRCRPRHLLPLVVRAWAWLLAEARVATVFASSMAP